MKHLKLIVAGLALMVVSLFAIVGVADAQTVKTGNNATVASGERIDSMLFAAGNTVNIAGEINGDVYCAGQNVTISGKIDGDVFCAGQNVTITGEVDGSVRVAGQTVTLSNKIANSATVAAQSFVLEKNGSIGKDLLGGTEDATIAGSIARDFAAGSTNMTVNGSIGRNIKGAIENLTVTSTGKVSGNVEYTSMNDPNVETGGQIAGTVTRTQPPEQHKARFAPVAFTFLWVIYLFIAMLLVALALALLFPSMLHNASEKALKNPGKTALTGLIAIFVAPLLIIALLISVIGIPLGLLVLLLWLVIVTLSGPLSGYFLGRLIMKNSKSPVLIMLVGASVLLLLYFIPLLGILVMFAAYLFGVGMFLCEAMRRLPKPDQKVG